MEERRYHLRSRAVHEGVSNDLVRLDFELEVENAWQPIELTAKTAPFRAFVCTAMMCQHAYLRMYANERGLVLADAKGDLLMRTEDWFVRDLIATFEVTLRQGTATADDLAFIGARMRECPIYRNLTHATKETTLVVAKE